MNFIGIGSIIDGVGKIADDLFTTEEEKLQIALKEKAMEVGLMQGQIQVNVAEAQSGNVFVAGWRPFIGWVGGLALAYQFLFYPLLIWAWALLQAYDWIPCHLETQVASDAVQAALDMAQCSFKAPPPLPSDALFAVVTGMLGIGGLRSYDKLKHTDTKSIVRKKK